MRALFVAIFALAAAWATPPLAQQQDGPAVTPELLTRAEAGEADAIDDLSIAYLIARDFDEAARWARIGAQAGRGEAMNNLAQILRARGRGRDGREAADWERRALAAGSNGARLNRAASIIFDPNAPNRAWDRALALLRAINDPRSTPSIDDIAAHYEASGFATAERARTLNRFAAERGAPNAQWRYAMMLRLGAGGPADVAQAYQWTRRAGENGDLNGMISTAVMLATGEGVTLNSEEAALWYQRAVDRYRSAHALRALGGMYLSGELAPDPARGWAYLSMAAEAGDEYAARGLEHFRPQITPQIELAARALRDAWLLQHGALTLP